MATPPKHDPAGDALMRLCFDALAPAVAACPHAICRASRAALTSAVEAVSGDCAVFGHRPLYDARGGPYLGEVASDKLDDFLLWELPGNQEYARSCAHAFANKFTAVIDLRTPRELLRAMYSEVEDDGFFYYDCIKRLARWMDGLTWAYVPLSDETRYAMFVAGRGPGDHVAAFQARMRQSGMASHSLVLDNGRYCWPAGIQ